LRFCGLVRVALHPDFVGAKGYVLVGRNS